MKIIYIMGAGRSGSTILDILLGNGEDILSCGKLRWYVAKQGIPSGGKKIYPSTSAGKQKYPDY